MNVRRFLDKFPDLYSDIPNSRLNLRTFLDEHGDFYPDAPKHTAAEVDIEDLMIVRTETGVFAMDRKTGTIYRPLNPTMPRSRRKQRFLKMNVGDQWVCVKLKEVDLSKPLVKMTPEERAEAAESMRVFREEDR